MCIMRHVSHTINLKLRHLSHEEKLTMRIVIVLFKIMSLFPEIADINRNYLWC